MIDNSCVLYWIWWSTSWSTILRQFYKYHSVLCPWWGYFSFLVQIVKSFHHALPCAGTAGKVLPCTSLVGFCYHPWLSYWELCLILKNLVSNSQQIWPSNWFFIPMPSPSKLSILFMRSLHAFIMSCMGRNQYRIWEFLTNQWDTIRFLSPNLVKLMVSSPSWSSFNNFIVILT